MEPMSIVVRFPAGEATPEQYEEVFRRIRESGNWPPDGLDYHVAFGPSGDFRVSEIWDSREQFGAFDEHLIPVVTDVGIPVSEPEMFEVHYIFKR
jgi:hypothetical protein